MSPNLTYDKDLAFGGDQNSPLRDLSDDTLIFPASVTFPTLLILQSHPDGWINNMASTKAAILHVSKPCGLYLPQLGEKMDFRGPKLQLNAMTPCL